MGAANGLLSDKTLTYRTTEASARIPDRLPRWSDCLRRGYLKSDSLPSAGVILAAGSALSVSFSPVIAWLGSLALVIGGIWLARSGLPSPRPLDGRSSQFAWSD